MTHRIDDYLDGALDRSELTPEERLEVDAIERAIAETRAFVHQATPDLTGVVMREVRGIDSRTIRPRSVIGRFADMVLRPREISFRLRPVSAIAVVAATVLLAVLASSRLQRSTAGTGAVAQRTLLVQFRLQADASTVRLAGSFTNWEPQYELHQTAPGIWTITLPLPLGVHDYSFVVDGKRWVADPYAQSVNDGFGGVNSRIAILPPDQPLS